MEIREYITLTLNLYQALVILHCVNNFNCQIMLLHLSYTPLKKTLESSHVKFFDSNMLSKPHWCRTSLRCKYFNVLNNVFFAQKKNTTIYASSCAFPLNRRSSVWIEKVDRKVTHKELVNFTYLLFLDKLKIWDGVHIWNILNAFM